MSLACRSSGGDSGDERDRCCELAGGGQKRNAAAQQLAHARRALWRLRTRARARGCRFAFAAADKRDLRSTSSAALASAHQKFERRKWRRQNLDAREMQKVCLLTKVFLHLFFFSAVALKCHRRLICVSGGSRSHVDVRALCNSRRRRRRRSRRHCSRRCRRRKRERVARARVSIRKQTIGCLRARARRLVAITFAYARPHRCARARLNRSNTTIRARARARGRLRG